MQLHPSCLKGIFRRIELFEKHLERQVPISKKLQFRLEYILIRQPFCMEFDIEIHVKLCQYNRSKVFMSEPKLVKREFENFASILGIDKVRFFLPNEPIIRNKKNNLEDIPIDSRVSMEYFSHLPMN